MAHAGLSQLVVMATLMYTVHLDDWHFTGPDMARGNYAEQGPDTFQDNVASRAVNGIADSNLDDGQCSHTGSSTHAWWKVEMIYPVVVKGVRIYNRVPNLDRLYGFSIVGMPGNDVLYDDQQVPVPWQLYSNDVIEVPLGTNQSYSQIVVTVPGNYLTLCEVEVYAGLCELPPWSSALSYNHTGDTIKDNYVKTGSILFFSCSPAWNYNLVGTNTTTCNPDGTYNEPVPVCEQFCPLPPIVINGKYTNDKTCGDQMPNTCFLPGDAIWYECNHGLSPRTATKLTCTQDSSWDETNPACINTSCIEPGHIQHGYYAFANGSRFDTGSVPVNTYISVVCSPGYIPLYQTRQCSIEGTWSGLGHCVQISAISCSLDSLSPETHNYTLDKNYTMPVEYDVTITGTCLFGYEEEGGDSTRTCLVNQTLSGTELTCSAVQCPLDSLHPSENFYMFNQSYSDVISFDDVIVTECLPFFAQQAGDTFRTCLANHSLSGSELLCSVSSTPSSEHSQHGVSMTVFGGVVGALSLVVVVGLLVGIVCLRKRGQYQAMGGHHGVQPP